MNYNNKNMNKKYLAYILTITVLLSLIGLSKAQEEEDSEVDPRMSEAFLRGYPDNMFYQIS